MLKINAFKITTNAETRTSIPPCCKRMRGVLNFAFVREIVNDENWH